MPDSMPPFEPSPALIARGGVRHGFFGRAGGVSSGVNDSLNVSERSGDDPANVAENLRRALAALGCAGRPLARLAQVHSTRCVVIGQDADLGADLDARPEADGAATARGDVVLAIVTADCAPVLLLDPAAGVIGACHAGWQGAVNGIVAETVAAMAVLGARPDRIVAAIGPTIGMESYEVGPEFTANLLAKHPDAGPRIKLPETRAREHFDLPGFVADRLTAAGVGVVETVGGDTYAEPARYFSHRRAVHQGTTAGRQIALIALE